VKLLQEKTDYEDLKTMFKSIDKNGDGRLSKEEIIAGKWLSSI